MEKVSLKNPEAPKVTAREARMNKAWSAWSNQLPGAGSKKS